MTPEPSNVASALQLIESLTISVVANYLYSFLTRFGGRKLRPTDRIVPQPTTFVSIFQEATTRTEPLAHFSEEVANLVQEFLRSPEVLGVMDRLFVGRINRMENDDPETEEMDIPAIKAEFLSRLSVFAGSTIPDIQEVGGPIFDVLLVQCDSLLNQAIEKGVLAAHDARENYRFQVLTSKISSLEAKLDESLVSSDREAIQDILEFDTAYRMAVESKHSFMMPTRYFSEKTLHIDNIYVNPKFTSTRNAVEASLTLPDLYAECYRTVILGNPGSGKSLLTEKVCYDLASQYSRRLLGGQPVTPVLVTLRRYAEAQQRGMGIVEYLREQAKADLQFPKIPNGAFEYLLECGRMIVVFDGLDELLETSSRQDTRDAVEAFCHQHPRVPVLVTSREIGYWLAPLRKMFDVWYLAEFDAKQVEEYVSKWFGSLERKTGAERERLAASFLIDSHPLSDIRSNPLMLALMCNLYLYEGYIPTKRHEIYRRCTELLYERWDSTRQITVRYSYDDDISPALAFLANWMYFENSSQKAVPRDLLVQVLTDFLCPARYSKHQTAERVADEFIRYCTEGRAWVFTAMGADVDGLPLYGFTHRTFLEYFAARHLVWKHHSVKELSKTLMPSILLGESVDMVLVAYQLLHHETRCGDELLAILLKECSRVASKAKRNRLLHFSARCLQSMVVSEATAKHVVNACLDRCTALVTEPGRVHWDLAARMINDLLSGVANRRFVREVVEKRLNDGFRAERPGEVEFAWELYDFMMGSEDCWAESAHNALDSSWEVVDKCIHENFACCYPLVYWGVVRVVDALTWYGVKGLFLRKERRLFPEASTKSLASLIIGAIGGGVWSPRWSSPEDTISDLKWLGQMLPLTTQTRVLPEDAWLDYIPDPSKVACLGRDPDMLFGLWGILAVPVEAGLGAARSVRSYVGWQEDRDLFLLLAARSTHVKENWLSESQERCGFSDLQTDLLERWICRKMSFVESTREWS